jgi:hypothetical protein
MIRFITLLIITLILLSEARQLRSIHCIVALCDNVNQGIVPVPKKIGNGQDPGNNLYWGCGYGIKTFFKKQQDWKLVKMITNQSDTILERLIFKHRDSAVILVADAYDGARIREATVDLLTFASGGARQIINVDSQDVTIGGGANLVTYCGHDVLMDLNLDVAISQTDTLNRDLIILACASKQYFGPHVVKTGATPLLWTTNLMCPEAYTLDAAIDSWIVNDPHDVTREKAAQTYNEYQKCGIKGARRLLVTGY